MKIIVCNFKSINGDTIDSFEYFYNAWKYDKNIKLFFIDTIPFTNDFLKNRYELDNKQPNGLNGLKCLDNIFKIKINDLINYQIDKMLVVNEHFVRDFGCLKWNVNEIHNIVSSRDRFKYNKEYTYSEYPDLFGDGEYYKPKIALDDLKKPRNQKERVFINCMAPNIKAYEIIKKYPNSFRKTPKLNIANLFEEFNKFVYIKTEKSYDRKPRLFAECRYFNIPIEYYNLSELKDGSTYRYLDLEPRNFDLNDIVISRFLN